MIRWSRLLVAIVAVFAVCTGVHADMMQASAVDVDVRRILCADKEVATRPTDSGGLFCYQSIADFNPAPVAMSTQFARVQE